jgi:hypothetical protein
MFTEQQIYLLKSALLPAGEAKEHWDNWKHFNNYTTLDIGKLRLDIFDRMDPETQKLLSLIYRNLDDVCRFRSLSQSYKEQYPPQLVSE